MSSISGEILSNYILNTVLGKGTFSVVKLATDIRTNEKIAIKILEKKKIKTTRDFNRIKREINIVKKINHLNIAKVFEIKEDIDKYYILMEFCEKGELFDLILSRRKLSEEESSYYFYQLVNGLEYIHLNNIIHRDLKPENLLLTKNNILKIIDFGLSNYNSEDNLLSTPCGSPCYASPEMVSGKKYNGFTNDIWSIGIILYAMIYGYLPFENINNNNDILFKTIRECKVDYPKNNCLLALDLLKKILVPDFNQRINIDGIKKHKFYLKGKSIFKRKHRNLNSENNFDLNENKIKFNKVFKKYSNSEFNSKINDSHKLEQSLNTRRSVNNNITYTNYSKDNSKKMLNKRNINSISPENIISLRNNYSNKYSIRSQSKNRQISNIEQKYFSILPTDPNNITGRETFNFNISNKTEMNLNPEYISQNTQRETNYIFVNKNKKNEIKKYKTRDNSIKEKIYPPSHIINYSDKFPDFNSFSMENDNGKKIIKEHFLITKRKKLSENKENYSTSEIRKIISDKNKVNNNQKYKEIKPIYIINFRPKKAININIITSDKKELKNSFIQSNGINKIKLEKRIKNGENLNLNKLKNKIYLDNESFNISNEKLENYKYKNYNTNISPNSNPRHINLKTMNNKYFININNNLRKKFSEDKVNNKTYSENNNRTETSLGIRKNYIKNNIKPFLNNNYTKQKNFMLLNGQINNNSNKNNFSSLNNEHTKNGMLNYRRINISIRKGQEESKEKLREEMINKNVNYSNKNIISKNFYKYSNINNTDRKYEYEKNKKNHETYTYIHKNNNDTKNKNDCLNNNLLYTKYIGNLNKEKEEISKINNSYDNNEIKSNNNYRIDNKLNINLNKYKKPNLPSITIDMNVLNKNNKKYVKLYDAIKNKL